MSKDTATLSAKAQGQPAVEAQPASAENTATPSKQHEVNESGVYFYIGPTIRGLIRTGDIFRGTRRQARKAAKAAIDQYPLVKTLIVAGDAFPLARLRVKQPGNALYANYQKIAAAAKEKAAAERKEE